jgi:hypothetical protein
MNHIHKLNIEIARLKGELKAWNEGCQELYIYLNSSKFDNDTTVQVNDIIRRILETKSLTIISGDEAAAIARENIESNISVSKAYKDGYDAYYKGENKLDNPFRYGPGFEGLESRNHASWNVGFDAAKTKNTIDY